MYLLHRMSWVPLSLILFIAFSHAQGMRAAIVSGPESVDLEHL